ncbi:HEPN domain-containing protein [Gloeobacter morelensis]|uniref:HEPN domain-containing protein n=1 Tax=Gloeobacter morelensis MG652769 TaxID=2781736 RepID=A0ABY3PM37_9CYAN|nr:HEPN domain-containing protein [Gloeobacter morelensis]UFP94653.1 HEPN domain-containing protein [Gloeobacter morelensis MG652769]
MTPEQERLLQRAEQTLKASRAMSEQGFGAESVSRAYYAMYYAAQAFLLDQNLQAKTHAGVIALFGQHVARTGRVDAVMHRQLLDAQDLRILADYDLDAQIGQKAVENLLEQAESFLQIAKQLVGRGAP